MAPALDLSPVRLSLAPAAAWQAGLPVAAVVAPAELAPGALGRKAGETWLAAAGGETELRVSLGPLDQLSRETLRRAGGLAARWLVEHETPAAGVIAAALQGIGLEGALEAFVEGLLLGAYRFDRHRSKPGVSAPEFTLLHSGDAEQLEAVKARLEAVLNGVYLARSVAHEPPNVINPDSLAGRARELAERCGLSCRVLDVAGLQALGAGAILAVGQGSKNGARLIALEYPGREKQVGQPPIVVVGKAITFDTGGYSIKDRAGMVGMKYDKAGGAAVLGILQAAAALRLPMPVVGLIAAAENMISAEAYRPNDILTSLSGQTVEVISADAEGRLVLADALTYAQRQYRPRAVIDLATLTGGVVIALGKVRAGLFANDDTLAQALFAAGEKSGERLWRLPLDDDYFELIKGDDSDFKNSSDVRQAHPIVGGIFLKQFIEPGTSWAHLDIAGPATADKDLPTCPKGATGFGVRLVLDYLLTLAESNV